MNTKQIITILLLVFVIGSVAYMFGRQAGAGKQTDPQIAIDRQEVETAAARAVPRKTQLVVYYFHGDQRCVTCLKLEGYAQETLETHFADQLADGQIIWKPVNVDEAANTHFVRDYSLVTKSVILSRIENGKEVEFRNLDRIWELVGDKDSYTEYIREQVAGFMEGASS